VPARRWKPLFGSSASKTDRHLVGLDYSISPGRVLALVRLRSSLSDLSVLDLLVRSLLSSLIVRDLNGDISLIRQGLWDLPDGLPLTFRLRRCPHEYGTG
jgi:hypothetical protein